MDDVTCNHWQVTSPEIYDPGSRWEPPEIFRGWALVEAPTPWAAKSAAIRGECLDQGGMEDWVKEARNEGSSPYTGLEVERCLCAHGTCSACGDVCQGCENEWVEEVETHG